VRRRDTPPGGRQWNGRRRDPVPEGYESDYLRNVRWDYRIGYGSGESDDPYRGGGSFGRGYGRVGDLGARSPEPGPPPRRERSAPYYREHPGGYRGESVPREPGRAARGAERGYPYFGSAAAIEGAQGYPPEDVLHPEAYPSALGWDRLHYAGEYEPPGDAAGRGARGVRSGSAGRGASRGRGERAHEGRGRGQRTPERRGHGEGGPEGRGRRDGRGHGFRPRRPGDR
jgi:hypothetical protein